MAQNSFNSSHSRSISNIPNHKKIISFMPKFLLKTLHRRKPGHHRTSSSSTTIGGIKYLNDPGTKNDAGIKADKIKMIGKRSFQKVTSMHILPPVSRRVTSIMSTLFKKNKHVQEHECEDHQSHNIAKKETKTSKDCKFGAGDVASVTKGSRKIRVKSARKNRENVETKGGLKIKRVIKMRIRDKERRFELCKKKILMGEKCRPLHGSLRYDRNGVLVPEGFS